MIRKLPVVLVAVCCLMLLAQTAHAGARGDLVPNSDQGFGPDSPQLWYLTNTNPDRAIKATVSVLDRGQRIYDISVVIPPGQSAYVGRRQASDQRGWRIVGAHYTVNP